MKSKTQLMDHRSKDKIFDWLYQENQEDDFLIGKTPIDLQNTWEDEE